MGAVNPTWHVFIWTQPQKLLRLRERRLRFSQFAKIGFNYLLPSNSQVDKIPYASSVARWLVLIGAAVLAGAFIFGAAVTMLNRPDLYQIMLKQFAAVVGLPTAALAS